MDRVIFRKWKSKDNGQGIIACLPDVEANYGKMMMYEHIGQHGEGDYQGVVKKTTLATPREYRALLQELRAIGYELKPVRKLNR